MGFLMNGVRFFLDRVRIPRYHYIRYFVYVLNEMNGGIMEMETRSPCSARVMLERAYAGMCQRFAGERIVLARAAMPEIANDSDMHRQRTGHLRYECVHLIRPHGHWIALGNGFASGAYPADAYDSDIVAVNGFGADRPLAEDIRKRLNDASYFSHSLMYALKDGRCETLKTGRYVHHMRVVCDGLLRYYAHAPEARNTSVHIYRPEAISWLTDVLCTFLQKIDVAA